MMKSIDAGSERFLLDLHRIQDRQARVQRQISSGYRVSAPSDDPSQVMNILELRSAIERGTIQRTNLQRVKAEVDSGEAGVRVAIQLAERARVLATQGANATATNRGALAVEVRQLHDQIVNLARTESEGRYVFSGDLDQQVLYATDWAQPGGVARAAVARNTRMIQDTNGSEFPVARSAHELFDPRNPDDSFASNNVLHALHSLATALENDDPAAVEAASPSVVSSIEHLNRELTFYGNAQNRVATAVELNERTLLARRTELSAAQDTDIAEALVELTAGRVHHETALAARAQMPTSTLFDFLA